MNARDALHLVELARCQVYVSETGEVRLVGKARAVLPLANELERRDAAPSLLAWLQEHGISRDAALRSLGKPKRRTKARSAVM